MKNIHNRCKTWLAALVVSLLTVIAMVPTVYADTDGQELLVTDQPDKLIIQLGTDWAGTEFELKTDVGLYPQPIIVSPEGILSMELGGSKTYTLSALSTGQLETAPPAGTDPESPPPNDTTEGNPEETDQTPPSDTPDTQAPDNEPTQTPNPGDQEADNNLIKGIPNMHLFLFAGGIIISVTGLIVMRVIKNRSGNHNSDDDEYDDDDY